MAKSKAPKRRKVSVWVGWVRHDPKVDLLKDLCGVAHYDIDSQEVMVDDKRWREQPVRALIAPLSYAESYVDAVVAAAKDKGWDKALYVVAQYDFVYDPKKVKRKVAPDPVFLGAFDYDDEGAGAEMDW
jgi:hypothetical protein